MKLTGMNKFRKMIKTMAIKLSLKITYFTPAFSVCCFWGWGMSAWANPDSIPKKNVLFLIVDDLRPELNCYGASHMHTPNIDRLAAKGALFENAYCNIPVSGASRASLMTGLRPAHKRWWDVNARIDKEAPEVLTLPMYFKQNGYVTISNSKVIHGNRDASDSWSEIWKPKGKSKTWRDYLGDENLAVESQKRGPLSYESFDVADTDYFDGKTAEKTIRDLQRLKEQNTSFFLAVGILKPHLPFNAPKKYWDQYAADSIQLPANFLFDRTGFPQQAFHAYNELRYYKNIPLSGDVMQEEAQKLIHGYQACVTYADAQIGKILDELQNLGLDKNTIVVLIGDHGWSLGEHGQWCKHSNFQIVNNSPMIIFDPDQNHNKRINQVVEFVDLYPTLCEAAGLQLPKHLQGQSMMGLIRDEDPSWKNCAIVKWHNGVTYFNPDYAYTEWRDENDQLQSQMLFDLKNDPQENVNVVDNVRYQKVVERLGREVLTRRGEDFINN